jgi:hypothetical protein
VPAAASEPTHANTKSVWACARSWCTSTFTSVSDPFGSELGFPGLTVTGSIGLLAPAGTPAEIIEQVAQAARKAVADPGYRRF